MKTILVIVKQVPDTETKIKLNSDRSGIDETGIKWILNPYDEYAVEEALKLKTLYPDSLVTVLSLGPKKRVVEALRTTLAMGADEAVVIDNEQPLDPYSTALALSKAIQNIGNFDIIFSGKLSIDGNSSSIPLYISEILNISYATHIHSFQYDNGIILVECETDQGKQKLQLTGPAILTTNKGLNTPRYATLPGIMKAKKKPIKEIPLADLNLPQMSSKVIYSHFELPAEKPSVEWITGTPQEQVKILISKLRNEAKVL